MLAYTDLGGVIEFGLYLPGPALLIARGPSSHLRNVVNDLAVRAIDGETLFVPGLDGKPMKIADEYETRMKRINDFRAKVRQRLESRG
ncbi:MAG TPA: hypothetical protein VHE37_10820 [Nevskiaceae bacterium]|nr:hypothetical protein [Nevskiaceae bacterium]